MKRTKKTAIKTATEPTIEPTIEPATKTTMKAKMKKIKMPFLDKLKKSLFVKISLVFVAQLLFVILLTFVTHRYIFLSPVFPAIQRNAVSHARFIIKEIGKPPDFQTAKKLAEERKLRIRIKTPTVDWASHDGLSSFEDIDYPPYADPNATPGETVYAGFNLSGFGVTIHSGDVHYLIILHSRHESPMYMAQLLLLFFLLLTASAIAFAFYVMKHLLKPVKILGEGVRQLSEGNIDYRMTTRRSDELGRLVNSFNTMARRIQESFKARERLLQDVSHELRSPLTRVKVALEFLEENDTQKSIRDDISEMETMISELLETDRLSSQFGGLRLENTELLPLVKEIAAEFENRKPGINIVAFPPESQLKVDVKRIKILFRNILENALRYSQPEGYSVEVSLRQKSDELTIEIQDFGCGIPEEDLPFLFEPFYRVDKSRSKKTGGYGLGMSLCKRIMEAHGGNIEISSRLNVGTTVFLKFKT